MKKLTDAERIALRTIGPPGEGPVPPEVFDELEKLGWGRWVDGYWEVTPAGSKALELDDISKQ